MKIGDKIYCIQNRKGDHIVPTLNNKGKCYTILQIKNDIKNNFNHKIISITCDKNNYHINCNYSLNGNPNDYYLFRDFFICEKEARRKKLKNLNFL